MDDQEAYLRDLEARTQAHVQRAHQRIRELERLRTETAAAFSQNRHKIETVMHDFDRMAQAQGYAGAFDDGTRGPHHENAPAPRRYVDPASGLPYWHDAATGRSYWDEAMTTETLVSRGGGHSGRPRHHPDQPRQIRHPAVDGRCCKVDTSLI